MRPGTKVDVILGSPSTPTDFKDLGQNIFSSGDLTPELGVIEGFLMILMADPEVGNCVQHGGTVTTLISHTK